MKLLIVILSPRDMPSFTLAINKIPHDKLWVKYVGYQHDPYGQWLQYFNEHKEYTHIAICPDDLIPHPKGVETLWEHAQTGIVVSSMLNVDKRDFDCPYRNMWPIAATKNLPTLEFPRNYDWYTIGEIKEYLRYNDLTLAPVPHTGAGFLILPRELVQKVTFLGDKESMTYRKKPSAYDVGISHDLIKHGITQYVDTSVFFAHFRYGSEIQNGKKEPHLIVDKWNQDPIIKPLYEIVPFAR